MQFFSAIFSPGNTYDTKADKELAVHSDNWQYSNLIWPPDLHHNFNKYSFHQWKFRSNCNCARECILEIWTHDIIILPNIQKHDPLAL